MNPNVVFVHSLSGQSALNVSTIFSKTTKVLTIGILPQNMASNSERVTLFVMNQRSQRNQPIDVIVSRTGEPSQLSVYVFDNLYWTNRGDIYARNALAVLERTDGLTLWRQERNFTTS